MSPATKSTRVQDVLEAWEIDARCRLEWHRETISHYRSAMLELVSIAGSDDIAAITVDHVLGWLTNQPSSKTRANKRSGASAVFAYAQMRGLVSSNPVACIKWAQPAASRRIGKPISKEEAWRVVEVARRCSGDARHTGAKRARIYMFLWGTAFRRSEAKRQLWSDVEWDTGMMRVSKGKVDRGDRIPLPDWLLDEMANWPRDGRLIFPVFVAQKSVIKDFAAAGITGTGKLHRFRSGAATFLRSCGLDLPQVAKQTRHACLNTLRKSYIEEDLSQLVAAQRLMAG
ncbi:MAG: tyrosine-type recombinase/integrase [Phycisphaerae bacterium]|nr:tyrosine-type recombinase/integrase [Phycisphaerae bacterium]